MARSEVSISSKRYTDEFKAEAVRQVTDRGFQVADVAERQGITTPSLDAWLRKFGKPGVVQRSALDQSAEVRRLKAELGRGALAARQVLGNGVA